MRPSHWTKNLVLLTPLPFSGRWAEPWAWLDALLALAAFCLISSGIYLFNDFTDRAADRLHPVKRHRAVASGRLSPGAALAAAIVLILLGAGIVVAVTAAIAHPDRPLRGLGLPVWTGAYIMLNLAYSLDLKRRPILDVVIVAFGFVLRAMAGAAAILVVISPWLVVCTFMLCLFIALAKRRSEIVELGQPAEQTRAVNHFYAHSNIEHMLSVSAGLAIVTYSLYCLAPRTIDHIGSANLVWTIPLVVYGMFRYYAQTMRAGSQDPTQILLRDKVLWVVAGLWLLAVMVVVKWGRSELLKGLLQ